MPEFDILVVVGARIQRTPSSADLYNFQIHDETTHLDSWQY